GLAQALVNQPELVFLDEPMSGLDPIGRRLVRDLIAELKGQGSTVFFSTHILPDAAAPSPRVGLLREGRLVEVGSLAQVLRIDVSHLEVLATGLGEAAVQRLPPEALRRFPVGDRWRIEVAAAALGPVATAIEKEGGRVLSVNPFRQSLEEAFFREITA